MLQIGGRQLGQIHGVGGYAIHGSSGKGAFSFPQTEMVLAPGLEATDLFGATQVVAVDCTFGRRIHGPLFNYV